MSEFDVKFRELGPEDRAAVASVLGTMRERPGDYYILDVLSGRKRLYDFEGNVIHEFYSPVVWTREDFGLADYLYHPPDGPNKSYQFAPEFVAWYFERFAPNDEDVAKWLGISLYEKWNPSLSERRNSSLFELDGFLASRHLGYDQYRRGRDHLKMFKMVEENGGQFEDVAWIYLTDKGGKWAMSGFPKLVDFDSHRTPVEVTVRMEVTLSATFLPLVRIADLPDEQKLEIESAVAQVESPSATLGDVANLFTVVNGAKELLPPFITAMKAALPQILDGLPVK